MPRKAGPKNGPPPLFLKPHLFFYFFPPRLGGPSFAPFFFFKKAK